MKKVVSVSLGSSTRDFSTTANYLGQEFEIQRLGVDGDMKAFAAKLQELDGNVDAIGLGGLDLYLVAGRCRYAFRDVKKLVSTLKRTPVVDGSGLKNTLERQAVQWLKEQDIISFSNSKTLVVCAVDRFGLAEEIAAAGGAVIYGDLMFNLGVPVPIGSFATVKVLARLLLPVVVQMPFQWLYPTGEKQEKITPKYRWVYQWADIIAGDFHIIRRYMPTGELSLKGKTIITNTTTPQDREELARRGLKKLITTTQSFSGRSAGTNVLEGVLVAALGRKPEELTAADYNRVLVELDWKPVITNFAP